MPFITGSVSTIEACVLHCNICYYISTSRSCTICACGRLKTKSWPMTKPKLMLSTLRRTWNWYIRTLLNTLCTLYEHGLIDDMSRLYRMTISVCCYAGSIWCVPEGVCFRRWNCTHVFDWQIRPFLSWLLFSTTICPRKLSACPTSCRRVSFRLYTIDNHYIFPNYEDIQYLSQYICFLSWSPWKIQNVNRTDKMFDAEQNKIRPFFEEQRHICFDIQNWHFTDKIVYRKIS